MPGKRTGRPNGRPRHVCDGSTGDYRSHKAHGEEPCEASVLAHQLTWRRYRRSIPKKRWTTRAATRIGKGMFVTNLPGKPGDDLRLRKDTDG